MLGERNPDREISEEEIFAKVDDILAARDVRMYLKDFHVRLPAHSISMTQPVLQYESLNR